MARILAQKFGGTSVATPESHRMVVGHIGHIGHIGRAVVVAVGQD